MAVELLINVVLLAGAPWLIAFLWRRREALLGAAAVRPAVWLRANPANPPGGGDP